MGTAGSVPQCHWPSQARQRPRESGFAPAFAPVQDSKHGASQSPALPEQERVLQGGERTLTFGSHGARLSLQGRRQSVDWGAVILQVAAAESVPLLHPAAKTAIGKQPGFPGKPGESGLLCLPCASGTLPSAPAPSARPHHGASPRYGAQEGGTGLADYLSPPFLQSAPLLQTARHPLASWPLHGGSLSPPRPAVTAVCRRGRPPATQCNAGGSREAENGLVSPWRSGWRPPSPKE